MKIKTFTETYFTQLENKYFQTNKKYLSTNKIIYTNHALIFFRKHISKIRPPVQARTQNNVHIKLKRCYF